MTMRKVGQVSFNLRDGYEKRLHDFATKSEHGEFSKYIKRLIERDMRGEVSVNSQQVVASTCEVDDVDVGGFL